MKRLHVHISVDDLTTSVGFYSTLFGTEPSVLKGDYAKWALDDPRVNFAISKRARVAGVDHLGIEVEAPEELQEVAARLAASGASLLEQQDAACCYARSDKAWVNDPQGIAWETFRSHGEITVYGDEGRGEEEQDGHGSGEGASACCDDLRCGTGMVEAVAEVSKGGKACCA